MVLTMMNNLMIVWPPWLLSVEKQEHTGTSFWTSSQNSKMLLYCSWRGEAGLGWAGLGAELLTRIYLTGPSGERI